jgi:hypothetical protein
MPDLDWVRDGQDVLDTTLTGFQALIGWDTGSGVEKIVVRLESRCVSDRKMPEWMQLAMTSAQARRDRQSSGRKCDMTFHHSSDDLPRTKVGCRTHRDPPKGGFPDGAGVADFW